MQVYIIKMGTISFAEPYTPFNTIERGHNLSYNINKYLFKGKGNKPVFGFGFLSELKALVGQDDSSGCSILYSSLLK